MASADLKKKARKAVGLLESEYPQVKCALNYSKPHELLIATRLSAQCTDKRVNMVTPELFSAYPDIESFADAEVADVEEYIKTCGLFKTKAADIVAMCRVLRDDHSGIIPDSVEELVKLPGVGRKTANLVVGDLYGKPAIVCDTHVIRVSGRLGLTDGTKDPLKTEKQLAELLRPNESLDFCHRLVWHGRLVCNARKPDCEKCCLNCLCSEFSLRNSKG